MAPRMIRSVTRTKLSIDGTCILPDTKGGCGTVTRVTITTESAKAFDQRGRVLAELPAPTSEKVQRGWILTGTDGTIWSLEQAGCGCGGKKK